MWYYVKQSAKKSYEACDTAGEKLAWFFGITKPKYYAEMQEFERMDEEVECFKSQSNFNGIYRNAKHGGKLFKMLNKLVKFLIRS
jgi:hypothetical protein